MASVSVSMIEICRSRWAGGPIMFVIKLYPRTANHMKYTLIGICLLLAACGGSELASDEIYGAHHEAVDIIPV